MWEFCDFSTLQYGPVCTNLQPMFSTQCVLHTEYTRHKLWLTMIKKCDYTPTQGVNKGVNLCPSLDSRTDLRGGLGAFWILSCSIPNIFLRSAAPQAITDERQLGNIKDARKFINRLVRKWINDEWMTMNEFNWMNQLNEINWIDAFHYNFKMKF